MTLKNNECASRNHIFTLYFGKLKNKQFLVMYSIMKGLYYYLGIIFIDFYS